MVCSTPLANPTPHLVKDKTLDLWDSLYLNHSAKQVDIEVWWHFEEQQWYFPWGRYVSLLSYLRTCFGPRFWSHLTLSAWPGTTICCNNTVAGTGSKGEESNILDQQAVWSNKSTRSQLFTRGYRHLLMMLLWFSWLWKLPVFPHHRRTLQVVQGQIVELALDCSIGCTGSLRI